MFDLVSMVGKDVIGGVPAVGLDVTTLGATDAASALIGLTVALLLVLAWWRQRARC